MTERTLRLWHRRLGMVLFVFLLVQAGSGLALSLRHALGGPPAGEGVHRLAAAAADLHHGGGEAGDLGRVLLAAGILVQAGLGAGIGAKARGRRRPSLRL
ncbi:hypothetical protein G3N55_09220 [Dissulfurirhabdus thermomarina]|uniref:PepSY domain-containing protein n=1 Tax=Dissulfurirhabdus thermomarina TaxID=1765737 RepID=A0A6N9TRG0_DISTH|nr:hypothetical protein [Dissulfurirhabdus thermomarina]NDY43020.1 hypothetical protein [Dissulfurirhabdus thermomarina]NMX22888.1 hypothetical protein [Dissulfurirhabdus thermomarina]